MNVTLKHWREAASLIITGGLRDTNAVLKHNHVSSLKKPSRQTWLPKTAFDYEVLLLQRSTASSFMPDTYVFPGGLVDDSDFCSDWMDVFKLHKHKPNFGLSSVKQNPSSRPPVFLTDRTKFGSPVSGDVAFRICAIRETFEESGILLVIPNSCDINSNERFTKVIEHDQKELAKWRLKVQSSPAHFIHLCTELGCMPNIWALHEWGNWLTPVASKNIKKRRYDTAFFICCLEDKQYTEDDQKEIVSFKWLAPPEAIKLFSDKKIQLGPPQFYELSRICHFSSLRELHRFSLHRALEGCECWLPVILFTSDGGILLLPGDELYPEEPDWTGAKKPPVLTTDKKREDLRKKDSRLHRVEFGHDLTIYMNIEPKYKHIYPLLMDSKDAVDYNSQL
uniref:Acyl-coenzyme A diphosphatase NUDT19 n=1 Tax=Geotrypetes seraphini TaxID=260995 RepID=A0A6P8QLU1_GEOSA|nr:nucleoside diphosphate-linked moiety X motif 19 [Geotrypetes seraphini]XP_033796865.1 nucleoside diphosphate-linked moiety X motif 19 [Geotrypetes seraphini]XP_033796866.1 nucleoside diphosphate-linked moiety X motif 19 [Geotrypetes seraphini]